MISNNLAQPIVKTATKAFVKRYDPKKPTFQVIFHELWDAFVEACRKIPYTIPHYIVYEVTRMIACGTLDMGFEFYECPNCHRHHIICYTCKSRFCPSCGAKATRARAYMISRSTLDVNHRHMVFTIDERLRKFFFDNPQWLHFLFDAAKEAIFYTFTNVKPSKKTARKKRKRKKVKDVIVPGFIITLHTYGRDLKWNPHVHVLCTEGGMNKDHVYKAAPYINYASLRKSFMKQVMDKMRDSLPKDSKEQKQFRKLMSIIYNEKTNGFYVHAPPREMQKNNGKDQVVQYMIRYAGKPAMAQSRIISYNYHSRMIRYYYEDHKTNERVEVEESVFRFMLKLIRHIPQPQFKMVRYYGIYAACDHKHKQAVKQRLLKQNRFKKYHDRPKHYRLSLIDTFGVDPLLCTCGSYMEFVDSYVSPRFVAGGEPP